MDTWSDNARRKCSDTYPYRSGLWTANGFIQRQVYTLLQPALWIAVVVISPRHLRDCSRNQTSQMSVLRASLLTFGAKFEAKSRKTRAEHFQHSNCVCKDCGYRWYKITFVA